MRLAVDKCRTLLGAYYAEATTYRAELFLWVMGTLLPFILMGVWMEAARQGDFGMTPADFARYFFAVFLVRNLTLIYVVFEFENDVVQGRLSMYLLQPLDPMWRYIGSHLAERMARLPFLVILAAIFFVLYPEALRGWHITPTGLAMGLLAIAMTFVMRFAVEYCFAMMAFWTERAHAVEQLWALPYIFLSGLIAPMEVYEQYSPTLARVLMLTPFPYLIYFPSRLLTGGEVNVSIAQGFGVLVGWTVVFYLLSRLLWRIGLKQYSAMGA